MQTNKTTLFVVLLCLFLSSFHIYGQPTPPNGKKWVKIEAMSDEFNGNSLDNSKWATQDPNWEGRRPARFETSSISVAEGNLRVTASKKTNPFSGWTHNGAMVRSIKNQQYGYFETRMKANKTFMSSTFWLMTYGFGHTGCDKNRYQELDIQETVGINTNGKPWVDNMMRRINSNTHQAETPPCPTPNSESRKDSAPLEGLTHERYYTYGCWWKNASELIFYIDGVELYTINPSVDFTLPMYLRMVLETYDWNPPKEGRDGMNDTFENRTTYYDWVHSYKLEDGTATPPTAGGSSQSAFKPHSIPGQIQAEDYDNGGSGIAYNETTGANQGGQGRTNQGVDIENTIDAGGGANVGWMSNGEWLEYTIANVTSGTYDIQFRVASNSANTKSISAKLGNTNLGKVSIPNTGGWQKWQDVTINNVTIAGGQQILRLDVSGEGLNINWLEFKLKTATTPPATGGADTITAVKGPTSITSGATTNVAITYTATQNREITVLLQLDDAPWTTYHTEKRAVNAGSGTINIPLSTANVAVATNNYQYQVFLSPTGGNWENKFSNVAQRGISVTNSATNNESYTIRAKGTSGQEKLALKINGTTIQTFKLTTTWANYSVTSNNAGTVRLEFNNDQNYSDVEIDYLEKGSNRFQAENQAINTGVWQNGSCGGAYSEWLHCNGYIEFTQTGSKKAIAQRKLTVYPNPASNQINIKFDKLVEQGSLLVRDNLGRIVKKIALSNTLNKSIKINELSLGIFYIQIMTSDGLFQNSTFIKKAF